MPERSNGRAWKARVRETVPRVRIPVSPPVLRRSLGAPAANRPPGQPQAGAFVWRRAGAVKARKKPLCRLIFKSWATTAPRLSESRKRPASGGDAWYFSASKPTSPGPFLLCLLWSAAPARSRVRNREHFKNIPFHGIFSRVFGRRFLPCIDFPRQSRRTATGRK